MMVKCSIQQYRSGRKITVLYGNMRHLNTRKLQHLTSPIANVAMSPPLQQCTLSTAEIAPQAPPQGGSRVVWRCAYGNI